MGFANIDFSMLKDIPLFPQRVNTQARTDFTNADFGQIRPHQDNQPRVIYLEFRMTF